MGNTRVEVETFFRAKNPDTHEESPGVCERSDVSLEISRELFAFEDRHYVLKLLIEVTGDNGVVYSLEVELVFGHSI